MGIQFKDFKKRLNLDYVEKGLTPDFKGATEKIKNHWDEFVRYKTSEAAKKRSKINKINAGMKKYHHRMGSAGYRGVIARMEKEEADLEALEIPAETKDWPRRSKLWFYGMGGSLDPLTGKCVFTKKILETPIAALKQAVADVRDGKFHPDREKDELSRALGNKEHKGRSRGVPGSPSWLVGFPESSDTYRSRERAKREIGRASCRERVCR